MRGNEISHMLLLGAVVPPDSETEVFMWLITQLFNDTAVLLWGIYTRELETYIHKNSSLVIFEGALKF